LLTNRLPFKLPGEGEITMTTALRVSSQSAPSVNASRPGESKTVTCDDGLAAFLSLRPRLFGIAYRMLRNAAEAEDVVQDVWLRWQTADRSVVRDAAAFLATTATRLAINVMQSARARRETYVGPWQPEPVDASGDARLAAERGQALACGVRMLLEKLTPTERAAYILREAFDYAYRDIAAVLRLAEANARQVVTRARQHIGSGRKTAICSTQHKRLLEAFIAAAQDGDVAGLEDLFVSGVVSTSDELVRAA
jgi:RNA polymerase sigma-70 factor (ECF subfamily)